MGTIVFGCLSIRFSSYHETYIWVISAIYKKGLLSACLMFAFFFGCIGFVIGKTHYRRSFVKNTVTVISMYRWVTATIKMNTRAKWKSIKNWTSTILFITMNVLIVTSVNGVYVAAVASSKYAFDQVLLIAFVLSLFKLIWGNFLLKAGRYFIEGIQDGTIINIALFNNLLAPLLAEMLVSTDCFLYIVSQAPALQFTYSEFVCTNNKLSTGTLAPCDFQSLIDTNDFSSIAEFSITPPFHYSYECSFSLISSYSFVFIFRYILSGLFQPIFTALLLNIARYVTNATYSLTNQDSCSPSRWLDFQCRKSIMLLLPPLWRMLLRIELSLNSGLSNCSIEFRSHLNTFKNYITSGEFRRRFESMLVTDLSLLVCFGIVFPPIAIVVAISIFKDIINLKLVLGRYYFLSDQVQDPELKEIMSTIGAAINDEMTIAAKEIWKGLQYGLILSTWIWAFILFDTLAASIGLIPGLCILLIMIFSPFILYRLQVLVINIQYYRNRDNNSFVGNHSISRLSLSYFKHSLRASALSMVQRNTELMEQSVEMKIQDINPQDFCDDDETPIVLKE
jgi:hypothetical protein